jgi:hypothetical protein
VICRRRRRWNGGLVAAAVLATGVTAWSGTAAAAPSAMAAAKATEKCTTVTVHKAAQRPVGGDGGGFCSWETGFDATEQQLTVDGKGTIYLGLTASGGAGLLRSRDNGVTWQKKTPAVDGKPALAAPMNWTVRDPDTGRIFSSSALDDKCLALLGDVVTYSDDEGDTWHLSKGQTCQGGDWGKTFIGKPATAESRAELAKNNYPNIIWHCSGATIQMTRFCWKSLDGGKTFTQTTNAISNFPDPNDPTRGPAACPGRIDPNVLPGQGVVTRSGQILIPVSACGRVLITTSTDDGKTWKVIDLSAFAKSRGYFGWDGVEGFLVPPSAGISVDAVRKPFCAIYCDIGMATIFSQQLALDTAGNLYFSWVDATDNQLHLASSPDAGKTWSKPLVISAPGVKRATIAAITAKAPGQIAVVYYGTRTGGGSDTPFDGYVTSSTDALSADPTFRSATVGRNILGNGAGEPIESAGVDFGPDGSVWLGYSRDTCVMTLLEGCDANLYYENTRYKGLVAHLTR